MVFGQLVNCLAHSNRLMVRSMFPVSAAHMASSPLVNMLGFVFIASNERGRVQQRVSETCPALRGPVLLFSLAMLGALIGVVGVPRQGGSGDHSTRRSECLQALRHVPKFLKSHFSG